MEVSGRHHAPAALPPRNKADIHWTGVLTGPRFDENLSGEKKDLLPLKGTPSPDRPNRRLFQNVQVKIEKTFLFRWVIPVMFSMINKIYNFTVLHDFSMALKTNTCYGLLIFTRFLDLTQRRTTVGRTPLRRVINSSQKPPPDNTRHSQQINIHAPGGIRTHDLSSRAAADLHLRPRDHRDRQHNLIT